MSRRTARSRKTSSTATPDPGAPPAPRPQIPRDAPSSVRIGLRAASVLAACWIAALTIMAFIAANPVTLNVTQVRNADYVVLGAVVDLEAGKVHTEREWKRGRDLGNITVENLQQTSARAGERYLIPLDRIEGDRYRITPTGLPGAPCLVYPDGDAARRQLDGLMYATSKEAVPATK